MLDFLNIIYHRVRLKAFPTYISDYRENRLSVHPTYIYIISSSKRLRKRGSFVIHEVSSLETRQVPSLVKKRYAFYTMPLDTYGECLAVLCDGVY